MSETLPVAVWSGTLFGLKVYVLDDGRRIVDADDVQQLLARIASGSDVGFDLSDFGEAYGRFMHGELPTCDCDQARVYPGTGHHETCASLRHGTPTEGT